MRVEHSVMQTESYECASLFLQGLTALGALAAAAFAGFGLRRLCQIDAASPEITVDFELKPVWRLSERGASSTRGYVLGRDPQQPEDFAVTFHSPRWREHTPQKIVARVLVSVDGETRASAADELWPTNIRQEFTRWSLRSGTQVALGLSELDMVAPDGIGGCRVLWSVAIEARNGRFYRCSDERELRVIRSSTGPDDWRKLKEGQDAKPQLHLAPSATSPCFVEIQKSEFESDWDSVERSR
ncbi:MAG: hypothetical protein ACJA1R_003105 [Flavobacteriales bacterium]|jgi:hypothetical protein